MISSPSTIFGGIRKRALVAPEPVASDGSARPVDYAFRATPLPAGDPVGHYAPWRPARIEIPDARPHPDPLVESVAMASACPPAPSYRPMFQPQAFAALLHAQLATIERQSKRTNSSH